MNKMVVNLYDIQSTFFVSCCWFTLRFPVTITQNETAKDATLMRRTACVKTSGITRKKVD